MSNPDIIGVSNRIRDGLLVLAMGIESWGRLKRIFTGDPKVERSMIQCAQLLYSISYGIQDFQSKLYNNKYKK